MEPDDARIRNRLRYGLIAAAVGMGLLVMGDRIAAIVVHFITEGIKTTVALLSAVIIGESSGMTGLGAGVLLALSVVPAILITGVCAYLMGYRMIALGSQLRKSIS